MFKENENREHPKRNKLQNFEEFICNEYARKGNQREDTLNSEP